MNNSNVRNAVLWLVILCMVVLVWVAFRTSKVTGQTPDFSELIQDVKDGKVDKIVTGCTKLS